MNEVTRIVPYRRTELLAVAGHPVTQAADGQPRVAWSLAEFDRMTELGFFQAEPRERI